MSAKTGAAVWSLMLTCLICLVLSAAPAHAATCDQEQVSGMGPTARFLWVAKLRAKAAWEHKVARTKGLGPEYAKWGRAKEGEVHCWFMPGADKKDPNAMKQCKAMAYPCRR